MAQRDYVGRKQSAGNYRKKSTSRKKNRHLSSTSTVMVAIAAVVVVAFVGALYFITHHKKDEIEAIPGHKVTGSGLPPKPEERWRYIKELENRQPGVRTPTEPSAGGEVLNKNQLTDEQRQLLEQMQADMRQQPTQLNEVPWNEQTPEQRLSQQTQHVTPPQNQRVTAEQGQPYQSPAYHQQRNNPAPKPAPRENREAAPAPITHEQNTAQKMPATSDKKDNNRWIIQCGSFKGTDQAESVRAQLAFQGFDSHISLSNGWNRVIMGPFKGKDNADNIIHRLKSAGHTNCIRLNTGG